MSADDHSKPPAHAAEPVWLELFFDLVYVTAILLFSTGVAEELANEEAVSHIAELVGLFVGVWWIWVLTTLYANRFPHNDTTHRLLVLSQMFFVTVFAMSAREGVHENAVWVSASFAILCAITATMYFRERHAPGTQGAIARSRSIHLVVAALIFGVSIFFTGAPEIVLWVIGLLVIVIPSRVGPDRITDLTPLNKEHIAERMGALTIIVCGEAFVKVASSATRGTMGDVEMGALALEFLLVFALWWSYFDDIPQAGISPPRFLPWLWGHLVLQLGLAATAIGVGEFVTSKGLAFLPEGAIIPVAASIAIAIGAIALIGMCTHRQPKRGLLVLRTCAAALVIIVGTVAWAIPFVRLIAGLLVVTIVVVVQAILTDRILRKTSVVKEKISIDE